MKIRELIINVLSGQFVKFAIIGVINTTINILVLFILVHYFGIWYMFSAFLAFLVAVTNSFVLNTLWTFKKSIYDRTSIRYSKFFGVSVIAVFFNLTFLYIFTEYFGLWYMASQLIAIILTLMINFFGNKYWTYK